MTIVGLDRHFLKWDERDADRANSYALLGGPYHSHDWPNLLKEYRVVMLAEAGSGKTEELREQARLLTGNSQFAFYATVQDVAREGLDGAVGNVNRGRLQAWRQSGQPAWFFIDSIDEAKLDNVRLTTALSKLADAIEAGPSRAHIVVSGRVTDWQFRADLATFTDLLPRPLEPTLLRPIRPYQTIKKSKRAPLVVLMTPLDAERIRRFASAKGVTDLESFIAALGDANLWSLARRPLDLDWLVTYWRRLGRFGPLAAMLEASLVERLRENNPWHAQNDRLNSELAFRALERVGAALVFGGADKLSIPDPEIMTEPSADVDLGLVLPDWSAEHRRQLLTRAVFDPATFGRVRLHNDNLGDVRSYLTARWLAQRRRENCSVRDLLDLLFADSYGWPLIKPSLRQTAAWLAIWDDDVAREIFSLEPQLLLTGGDSASLTSAKRSETLRRVVEEMLASGARTVRFDQDALKRFSHPDLVSQIRTLWTKHKEHQEIRGLLLQIVWLGRLRDCADLAVEALFGGFPDSDTQVFAGRALCVTGDSTVLARYVDNVKVNANRMPGTVFWDALDQLFPVEFTVNDLLMILASLSGEIRDGSSGLSYHGPRLVARVTARVDLERLLSGLLSHLGVADEDFYSEPPEDAYYPIIAATAHMLIQAVGADNIPMLAIDAALRLGEGQRYRPSKSSPWEFDLDAELRNSSQRRRAVFWRAAEHFAGHKMLQGQGLRYLWQLDVLGWTPCLTLADLEWLLTDIATRASETECYLACTSGIYLWDKHGRDAVLLARIQAATAGKPTLVQVCEPWMTPRVPSAQEQAATLERLERDEETRRRQADDDRSWRELLDRLRANPDELHRLPRPIRDNFYYRVFSLWESVADVDIDDVHLVEPVLGAELTIAFRDALVDFWRQWSPTTRSSTLTEQRHRMASAGVSIDAKITPNWPSGLSAADARKAAAHGVHQFRAFPVWFMRLALSFPVEVRSVLMVEIHDEIDNPRRTSRGNLPVHPNLDQIVSADLPIAACVAPVLFDLLGVREDFPPECLPSALAILLRGLVERRIEFTALVLARFASAANPASAGPYISAALKLVPAEAFAVLITKLDSLNPVEQTVLMQHVLPNLFGSPVIEGATDSARLPFDVLERLVQIAFRTIRIEDDRRSTGVFGPDWRDKAQEARDVAFDQLCLTPGRATFECLGHLARQPGFPISSERLLELAFTRAAIDAEHSRWHPGEAHALEHQFDAAPNTPADLQAVVLRRLTDLQHALHNGDFAQGGTLKGLQGESAVQNWIADHLRNKQGRAYSVEREPHVVEEKEPDIRLRARSTDASLPLEIKIAERWTLTQLEAAITDQLGGRYLRAQDARHGVLLLIHQEARDRGWLNAAGRYLGFSEVVAHLTALAAAAAPDAPQARVAVLDVSGI